VIQFYFKAIQSNHMHKFAHQIYLTRIAGVDMIAEGSAPLDDDALPTNKIASSMMIQPLEAQEYLEGGDPNDWPVIISRRALADIRSIANSDATTFSIVKEKIA
jgi:hypothetical protein